MTDDTGLALDRYFDFRVDSTGDIDTVSNAEELHKDLSGLVWAVMQRLSGTQARAPTTDTIVVKQQLRSLLKDDVRVIEVSDIDIGRGDGPNQLRAEVVIESLYGQVRIDTAGFDV